MLASSSSRLIDDFDENSDEKHFYSSSLTAETANYHSTFLDDFCEQTIKDEEFTGEEQLEATSTSHCRTNTVEFDPHLAIIIENELGLNDPQTSRKNAWGNLSYAELIAKAIEHSQDKRLTLSQIYSWMIQYVPYFRDKGDRKSSTGWKNSIRHNLSLHNRFVRIPNEIAGKSSWWTIDPRAKQVRGRRRIQSNENAAKPERRRLNKNISNETNNPLSASSSFDYLFSNEQQIPTSSSNEVFLATSTPIRTQNHILHANNSLLSTPSPTNTLTSSNTTTATTNLNSQTPFTSVRDMNKNLYNLLQNHSQDQTYQYPNQTHVHHVSHSHHQQQQQQQQQTSQSQQGHHYQLTQQQQQQQQQQQTVNGSSQLTPTILHDMLKSSSICLINSNDNHLTSGMDSAYSSLSKSPSTSSQSPSPSQCDYEFDQMISSKFSKQLKTMDRSSPLFRRMVLAIMRHQMNKSKSTNERKKPISSHVSTMNSSISSSSSCPTSNSVLFDPLSSSSPSMTLIGSSNIDLDLPSTSQNCSLPNSTFDLDVEAILDFERTTFGDCSFDIHDLPNL